MTSQLEEFQIAIFSKAGCFQVNLRPQTFKMVENGDHSSARTFLKLLKNAVQKLTF